MLGEIWEWSFVSVYFFNRFSFHSMFPWKPCLDLSLPCPNASIGILLGHFWRCSFMNNVWCWIFICTIHEPCGVLLKINVGFSLALPWWTFVCIQFEILGKFWMMRFEGDEAAWMLINPNPICLCPEICTFTRCMALFTHAPITTFPGAPQNGVVLINESPNYKIAMQSTTLTIWIMLFCSCYHNLFIIF